MEKVNGGHFTRHAGEVLDRMDRDRQPREVTRYRRTRAFLLPPEEYERLMELDEKYGTGAAATAA